MLKANRRLILIFIILNIIVPLFVGVLLYLFLRPDAMITILCKRIFQVPLEKHLNETLYNYSLSNIFMEIIRNHLADGLWAYASAMILGITAVFWDRNLHHTFLLCIFIDFFMELIQVINPYFTFDFIDLLCEMLFTFGAWGVLFRFSNKTLGRRLN